MRAFLNLLGPDTDEAAIDRWVYARTAELMGVVVDDRSVGEILSLIMLGEQDPQRFLENALRNFGPGMNPAVLVEVMRQQLLALRLMQALDINTTTGRASPPRRASAGLLQAAPPRGFH